MALYLTSAITQTHTPRHICCSTFLFTGSILAPLRSRDAEHAMNRIYGADQALQILREGNERFRSGASRSRTMSAHDFAELAKTQRPFATIIGCSDSRVPPELIFDALVGELFIIRIAGNVLSSEIAGSLQYAGEYLHTPLFLVLGHSGCGAVSAALHYHLRGKGQGSRIQV